MNFHPQIISEKIEKTINFFDQLNLSIPSSGQFCPNDLEVDCDWLKISEIDLKLSFPKDDIFFKKIRKIFVKPVTFVSAGPGDPDLITVAGMKALQECDICFYDALVDKKLLEYLPKQSKAIYVGKRAHNHSTKQQEICRLLQNTARSGLRVVRLKGGDSGIFGRLTEETECLTELELPFRVIPGVSSFIAATTGTGLLLTRRDIARGFRIQTPRGSKGTINLPNQLSLPATEVFFMAISCLEQLAEALIESGRTDITPVSVIFSAGTVNQKIVCGSLQNIYENVQNSDLPQPKPPGLIIVGESASEKYLYKSFSPLCGKTIKCDGSKEKQLLIRDLGATFTTTEKPDFDLSDLSNLDTFSIELRKLAIVSLG